MAIISVTVEPGDGTEIGWFIQCFSWTNGGRDLVSHHLEMIGENDGKFTFTTVDLNFKEYGLRLALMGSGRKVKAKVTSPSVITYPRPGEWPLTVEVPATATQYSNTWFFRNEGAA